MQGPMCMSLCRVRETSRMCDVIRLCYSWFVYILCWLSYLRDVWLKSFLLCLADHSSEILWTKPSNFDLLR